MALLSKGGTSRDAATGSARILPAARSQGIRSLPSGCTPSSRAESAASTGLSSAMLASLGDHDIGKVAGLVSAIQLFGQDAVPGGAAGAGGAGPAEPHGAVAPPVQAAALPRGAAEPLPAQLAEPRCGSLAPLAAQHAVRLRA